MWPFEWRARVADDDTLRRAGEVAIQRATTMWERAIYDPRRADTTAEGARCKLAIDSFIRDGLGWTWEPRYAGDGAFEWCGAFAAWCWPSVKPELRRLYWASTYRLDRFARYGSVSGERNRGSGRLIAELDEHSTALPWDPRPGDVLLIGPPGSGYGRHICLVESFADGVFHTLEGNGTGRAPDGRTWQGVVRGQRRLGGTGWHARRLIRPSVEDIVT